MWNYNCLSVKDLLVTTVLKCVPSYPDSHVLNQSSVVIVTADCAGPAAPVSLFALPRPAAYMRSNWALCLLGEPLSISLQKPK